MRRALAFAVALTTLAWAGCSAKKQTEYVAAVSTQVKVPRDLKSIRFSVSVGGVRTFCRGYRVYDGKVQLPRSLGTFAENPGTSEPITYTILGYTSPLEDGTEFDDPRCSDVVGTGTNDARILKRSRQPYITDEVLFLPLALKYACFDKTGCKDGETCKGGRCVDATIDTSVLPLYTPDLVDGTGATCFHAAQCFTLATEAAPVDPETCTYAVPLSASAPPFAVDAGAHPSPPDWDGVNVEVVYDGGFVREVLDKDADDGFSIPDPAKPQQFRLAPGLCDMVKGGTPHRITSIRASGSCRAKLPTQPLCADDGLAAMGVDTTGTALQTSGDSCAPTELKPPKAVLIVVVDDTQKDSAFFDQAGPATVSLSLSDPAFSRTDVGLVYAPGNGTCGAAGSFSPAIAPAPARDAKTAIAASFASEKSALKNVDDPNYDGVLRDTYATLAGAAYASYFRKAVLVLGARKFNTDSCAGAETPVSRAADAHAASKIDTYAIDLVFDPDDPSPDPNAPASADEQALATAGGTTATAAPGTNKAPAKDAFQKIVESLATCVYDVDPGARPDAAGSLSYFDPGANKANVVDHAAGCNAESSTTAGWGYDAGNPNRIYLCGAACTTYRGVLNQASLSAAAYGKPSPAVPIFAHKPDCAPKP